MKKPIHDELELQLQEYTWQTEDSWVWQIEWTEDEMPNAESADIEDGTPEYRH